MNENELMHYSVLGMKWGVHKGNVSQAYGKATTKRRKLENNVTKAKKAYEKATVKANTGVSYKYQKLQAKADRLQSKADRKKYGFFTNANKAAKLQVKAGRTKAQYIKAQRKAERWIKAMDKTFKDYDVNNLPTEKINKGKEFVKSVS